MRAQLAQWNWVGQSITADCGVEVCLTLLAGQALCPDCAQNRRGPERLWVRRPELPARVMLTAANGSIGSFLEVKAKMEALRGLGGAGWICRSGPNIN